MPRSRSSGALSIESNARTGHLFHRQHFGDGSRQRRLAVVNVADRADIDMRLVRA